MSEAHCSISIFGLGYVGCVDLACLAAFGHHVIGVAPQVAKVDCVNAGNPTVEEKELGSMMAIAHAAGIISATTDSRIAIAQTEVSLVCVGTPSLPDGTADLTAILKVAEEIGRGLTAKRGRHVIALRSTVPPGTNAEVSALIARVSGRRPDEDFAVVSNPEFLREGCAVADFKRPAFTVLGTHCEWAAATLRAVYASVEAPVEVLDPRSAELLKYACNSFHALKVTFANEVGNLCGKLGIDARSLMEVFCRDTKLNLSSSYLKPGFAYGGSCLPKDVRALCALAETHDLPSPVLNAISSSNEHHQDYVYRQIRAYGLSRIGILGLAFKNGTDDVRESPIVDVIVRLLADGLTVRIYDPLVRLADLHEVDQHLLRRQIPAIADRLTNDLHEVIADSDLVVLFNDDAKVRAALASARESITVYDIHGLA
jgi:GDP-mannose 6-dehydrogenase